ncbi:MAG: FHA domain-containing protein [Gammaproteobacteria bacterium]|nr:FHA domain-containing protein [Gammaproteobacteria bacterium]
MTTIIVTHEDNEVDEFEFDSDTQAIAIGRRSSNDVCIPNLSVSGMHARVTFDDDSAWIEDLNSTNGTYINGRLISRQRLNHHDEIIIGKTRVTYMASVTAETAQEAVASAPVVPVESARRKSAEVLDGVDADDSYGDFSDVDGSLEGEGPMSLTDKAKLALGRPTGQKPRLKAIAGSAGVAAVTGVAASAHRAVRTDPAADTSAATIGETVNADPHLANEHPLDGIDRVPTPDEVAEFDSAPSIELDAPSVKHAAVIEIKNGAKSGQILPIDKPVTTLGRPGIQIAAIMRKPDGYFVMHIESDDSVSRPTLNNDAIGDEPVLLHSGDELNVAGINVEFMLS